MRRTSAVAIGMVVLGAVAATGTSDDWTPTATGGGFVNGPIEHVTTVPIEAGGGSDAVRYGDNLVVSSFRSFSIYDVSDPVAPELLSTTPLGPALYNERPRTNGEILLISNDSGVNDTAQPRLDIYDIRDPEAPVRIGRWNSTRRDHIWTCVLNCAWAYSAGGTVLDLSDPTAPRLAGDLVFDLPFQQMHVVEEVDHGIVIFGSNPTYVVDARQDPTDPTILSIIEAPTTTPGSPLMARSIPARVAWPKGDLPEAPHQLEDGDQLERDRLTIMTMETPFTGSCDDQSGWVLTFDTSAWRGERTWQHLDTFQITSNGTYADGAPPYNALGCGSYGLDPHPTWGEESRRRAAVAWFEHGLRVLDVDADGGIHEVAGWLPAGGNAMTPIWITDDLLYVIDVHRGIDILRVTG